MEGTAAESMGVWGDRINGFWSIGGAGHLDCYLYTGILSWEMACRLVWSCHTFQFNMFYLILEVWCIPKQYMIQSVPLLLQSTVHPTPNQTTPEMCGFSELEPQTQPGFGALRWGYCNQGSLWGCLALSEWHWNIPHFDSFCSMLPARNLMKPPVFSQPCLKGDTAAGPASS